MGAGGGEGGSEAFAPGRISKKKKSNLKKNKIKQILILKTEINFR